MPKISAGLLLFRRTSGGIDLFLAHPGGPFWKKKEEGAWTIPKGLVEVDEEPLETAIREFREETGIDPVGPFLDLGDIRQKGGKVVYAWAWEGDADASSVVSNLSRIERPRGSGRWLEFPEVDRCGWFDPERARVLLNPAQAELVTRLADLLEGRR
ncbi:MAG: NUDIX domain-containing protein [Gemmatimonas sp.]|nr:NUDIX domain-containing protein [Gemmatimonas sp.]